MNFPLTNEPQFLIMLLSAHCKILLSRIGNLSLSINAGEKMSLSLYMGGGAKGVLFFFYSLTLWTGFSFARFLYDPRASPD